MKRLVSIIIGIALVLPLLAQEPTAQEPTAQPEVVYTPQQGEWAVGFTLNPILNFVGNMFNGTAGQIFDSQSLGGQPLATNANPTYPLISIMGKYMVRDNVAIRANIGLLLNVNNRNFYVRDDKAVLLDPLSVEKVTDKAHSGTYGGSVFIGAEYRVGKKRVQGVFGGGLNYAFSVYQAKYSYGNAITEANQTPTMGEGMPAFTQPVVYMPNARTISQLSSGTHTIGLVGNVGIECFVAPKISLGLEANLAILYRVERPSYKQLEGYNLMTKEVQNYTDIADKSASGFVFGTQNVGANIFMNFYF